MKMKFTIDYKQGIFKEIILATTEIKEKYFSGAGLTKEKAKEDLIEQITAFYKKDAAMGSETIEIDL